MEHNLETLISVANVKAAVGAWLAGAGFVRKDEDVVDIDFTGLTKSTNDEDCVEIKFKVQKLTDVEESSDDRSETLPNEEEYNGIEEKAH